MERFETFWNKMERLTVGQNQKNMLIKKVQ